MVDKPLIPVRGRGGLRRRHPPDDLRHRPHKRSVEDHFDTAYRLESELEAAGRTELLNVARSIAPADMNCVFVRQPARTRPQPRRALRQGPGRQRGLCRAAGRR